MAAKNVGTLIREARNAAGLTQEQLAKKIDGLSASDISKAERGEKELTQAQLKAIAKATGVTQSSLLNAPKGGTASSGGSNSSASSSSSSSTSMKVSAAEKKLVQLYRKADAATKKAAVQFLEQGQAQTQDPGTGILNAILDEVLDAVTGKK